MSERRRVAVLTTGRQDYGILRSTLVLMENDPRFDVRLWVGGMHLKPDFGRTVELVREDGRKISRELDFVADASDPCGDVSRAVVEVHAAIAAERPEMLVLVGDRSETLAAAVAATVDGVPIVHLHGGEETEGAIDNAFRHALTKLGHLHLVSHERHARRVLQMGEDPAYVVVVGAPGLDNRFRSDLPGKSEIESELGSPLAPPVVVVTMHPTTLGAEPLAEVSAVAAALDAVPAMYVISQPNADGGGIVIRDFWINWARGRERVVVSRALGERLYWGLLRHTDVVLGNSSSGVIEAPALGIPVVSVGGRQKGRSRYGDVTDVPPVTAAVATALRDALARAALSSRDAARDRFFADGPAAPRILEAIDRWRPSPPVRKKFHEIHG